MTGGGPGYASETLNIMGFKYSFEYFRMGQSSVILVVLFLVVFACSLGIMKLRAASEKSGKSVEEIRRTQQAQIPAGRYGTPEEFGAICAFLCSQQAAYMTGQNVLADGGAYPGTF